MIRRATCHRQRRAAPGLVPQTGSGFLGGGLPPRSGVPRGQGLALSGRAVPALEALQGPEGQNTASLGCWSVWASCPDSSGAPEGAVAGAPHAGTLQLRPPTCRRARRRVRFYTRSLPPPFSGRALPLSRGASNTAPHLQECPRVAPRPPPKQVVGPPYRKVPGPFSMFLRGATHCSLDVHAAPWPSGCSWAGDGLISKLRATVHSPVTLALDTHAASGAASRGPSPGPRHSPTSSGEAG